MQTNGIAQGASVLSVLDTLKRRKFYILVPALVLTACVVAFVSRLPDWYRAQALLAVEQAAASEYLRGPAMLDRPDIQEQFRVIRETLLAQPLLEEIIKEFKLYELAGRDPDRTLEDMKKRIRILVEGKDAFYVGFEGRDRLQVTEVANRLAELFIRNTSELRERHEDAAVGFVEEELARLKEKLTLQDERIKQYKQRVGQDLPEYLAVNLKTLESLQSRLQTKRDSISENQARRVAVLEQMKGLQDQETQKFREPAREESAAEKRLDELRFKLKDWEGRYTEQYPDLPRLRKEIRELEQTLAAAPPKGRAEAPTGAMRSLELKAELEGIDQRLRSYEQDERELSAQIAGLQQRLASVPTHDRELAEMMREQQVTRSQYQSLLDKQHEVKLAGRLQKTGQGRVFKIVEPARVPQSPYFPQRERLILLGFLASLGLGVVLA